MAIASGVVRVFATVAPTGAVDDDGVGERAADVDADAHEVSTAHRPRPVSARRRPVRGGPDGRPPRDPVRPVSA